MSRLARRSGSAQHARPTDRRRGTEKIRRWIAAAWLLAGTIAVSAAASKTEVEARAKCITHEGADVPVAATRGGASAAAAAAANPQCAAEVLDGTVCNKQEGPAALQCLARELRTWDAVLDLLVDVAADRRPKQAAIQDALKAFRSYRDKSCRTFNQIAVNPAGPEGVAACRLEESARFTQRIYNHFYSP